MADIEVVPFTSGEISPGVRLSSGAGWNQTEQDWFVLLALSSSGSVCAKVGGRIVGTTVLLDYECESGGRVGWICMVLVDAAYRRRGIGRLLMERALEAAGGMDCIGLDATPEGSLLYEKLGFEARFSISRWVLHAPFASGSDNIGVAVPLPEDSLSACIVADSAVSGFRRRKLLEALYGRTPSLSAIVEIDSHISGFLLARRGTSAVQIGPVMASDSGAGGALVRAIAARISSAIYVDVPDTNLSARAVLEELGFIRTRSFLRMVLSCGSSCGFSGEPPQELFAIAGPEFG